MSTSKIRPLSGLLLLCAAMATSAHAAPTLEKIAVSRTEGVAPLAVLFDATAARDGKYPRAFHSLLYEWSFADASSGDWGTSGKSRNAANGPVAGHVFATAGKFTVRLRISNPAGETTSLAVDIHVLPPEKVYPSELTFCYATSGTPGGKGFEGCPAREPKQHVVISDFNRALFGRLRTKSRHLFRRGDTFTQSAGVAAAIRGPLEIGAFGKGPKPILQSHLQASRRLLEARDDWRFVSLSIRGSGGTALSRPGQSSINIHYPLFLDIDATGVTKCAEFTNAGGRSTGFNRHIAVVDFSCKSLAPAARGRAFFDRSFGSMFMGLDLDLAGSDTTMFRTVYMNTSVIQHSRMRGGRMGTVLALRACGQDNGASCPNGGKPNQYIVISDNTFVETSTNAPIRTCLHSECDRQGTHGNQVADLLFERNHMSFELVKGARTPSNARYIQIQGADVSVRNNIFDLSGAMPWNFDVVQVDSEGPSDRGKVRRDGIIVEGNTVFAAQGTKLNAATLCRSFAGSDHYCRNNLLFAPSTEKKRVTQGSGWTEAANLRDGYEYQGSPFSAQDKSARAGTVGPYTLAADSAAVDTGYDFGKDGSTGGLRLDFTGACRPAGPRWDVGALERGARACSVAGR